jgi:hypothetical protein
MWRRHERELALVRENEALKYDYRALADQFSVMQEVFSRVIQAVGGITFDASEPVIPGRIKWAQVRTESDSVEMSAWFETENAPEKQTEEERAE